jgi:hypothetical protein
MHGSVGGRSGGRFVLIAAICEGYEEDRRNRVYGRYHKYENYLIK